MASRSKRRRNTFLAGAGFLFLGILELITARLGEKTQTMIPAGHVSGEFITPTQGYVIATLFFVAASYAIARAFVAYKDQR